MQRFGKVGGGLIFLGLAISSATSSVEAKTIKIFNPTNYAIVALQAKKPAATEWQPDLLGKTALGVGKLADVEFAATPDCIYDLRATFDDGHKVEKPKVDVCVTDIYQFTDK